MSDVGYPQDLECWFLTGSQELYGDEHCARSPSSPSRSWRCSTPAPRSPCPSPGSRCSPARGPIRRACLDATSADRLHRRGRLDAHFLAGEDVDRRARRARKPLLHLHTQANRSLPWASIDMDFMNLNQAAHGDREFGYVQTRMAPAAQDRGRPRQRPRGARRGRRWARPPRGWHAAQDPAARPLRRQHARRRRHRGRQGRGRDPLRVLGQHLGRQRPRRRRRRGVRQRRRRPRGRVRGRLRRRPRLRRAATATSRCATPPASRLGLRAFLDGGGFGAFTTNFEDLGGLRQLPGLAVQRLMADGYGFGAEGDWKTSVLRAARSRSWRRAGPAGSRSWRTTPTTSAPASRRSSAPTCSRSAPPSPPAGRAARSTPWHRRPRGPGPAGFRRRSRPGFVVGLRRPGRPLPPGRQRHRGRPPRRSPCPSSRWPAPSGSLRPTCPPRRSAGSPPAAPTTRRSPQRRHRGPRGLRRHRRRRARPHRRLDDHRGLRPAAALGPGLLPPRPRPGARG